MGKVFPAAALHCRNVSFHAWRDEARSTSVMYARHPQHRKFREVENLSQGGKTQLFLQVSFGFPVLCLESGVLMAQSLIGRVHTTTFGRHDLERSEFLPGPIHTRQRPQRTQGPAARRARFQKFQPDHVVILLCLGAGSTVSPALESRQCARLTGGIQGPSLQFVQRYILCLSLSNAV